MIKKGHIIRIQVKDSRIQTFKQADSGEKNPNEKNKIMDKGDAFEGQECCDCG